MMKRIMRSIGVFLLAAMIIASDVMTMHVKADANVNGYESMTTLRGQQIEYEYVNYGGQHAFWNYNITTHYIPAEYPNYDGIDKVVYEGETFRFYDQYDSFFRWVRDQNQAGRIVNVQFLITWESRDNDGGGDLTGRRLLIDEPARSAGHPYYAPATDDHGRKILKAFWTWMFTGLAKYNAHIDNYILGNEVNMPNQWHYAGGISYEEMINRYAISFYDMRSIIRRYSGNARCSICMDHSWTHNDEGRGIAAKDFISAFNNKLTSLNGGKTVDDWCMSLHLYPAILFETMIWQDPHAPYPGGLNELSEYAKFVDGKNLSYVTNYIKNTYGENHRIMLTEQGFSDYYGEDAQAASMAYSYYAAKYDPMVDCFILNTEVNGDSRLNFSIDGKLAGEIYRILDDPSQQSYIANRLLPVIGVGSWSDIVPNYGQTITRKKYVGSGYNNGISVYDGVDYSAVYNKDFYVAANPDLAGLNDFEKLEHFVLHGMAEARQGSAEFNARYYKNNYEDLAAGYGEDWKQYYLHYLQHGKAAGRIADRELNGQVNPDPRPALVIDSGEGRPAGTLAMHRLYNPNSGEHFYTSDESEIRNLYNVGWNYEHIAWFAPGTSLRPVYRLYNPNAGDHHYTSSAQERDNLVAIGWQYEGIGWYSDDYQTVPLYRLYNPNAVAGSHHYTASVEERDYLAGLGWQYEGIGWYGR